MLQIQALSYRYRGCPEVLKALSFEAQPGELVAILGNNGAGKSTLLKCMNCILRPDGGRVLLEGEDLLTLSQREVARHLAFVAQTVPDTQMTVHDVVMLGRRPYMQWGFTEQDHAIVHGAMDRLGVEQLRGRFLSNLSGGERQKVMLARALAQQPKVLLLDEPTSALDIRNQHQVLGLVREACRSDGMIALAVLHDLNLALRYCHRFVLLKEGQVYRCGDRSVLDPETLLAVYGVKARVVQTCGQYLILMEEQE